MELREVSENGVISIGGQLYLRRNHQGSVVNMQLVYPVPHKEIIHKFPEATSVRPPKPIELQHLAEARSRMLPQ